MSIPEVELNDGTKIPQIAYGTGTKHRGTDISGLVRHALSAGFAHIDGAQIYRNEDTVGAALHDTPRDKLFLTSKYFAGGIDAACRASLQKLRTEYLDLYLVHMPRALGTDAPSGWREMEQLKTAGLVRSIGVSNYTREELEGLLLHATVKPSVNQIRLHLYCYEQQKPLLDLCAQHGIVIEAYNVLTPLTQAPGGPVDAPLYAAAQKRGCTPAQILFLWLLAKGIVVISTTSNPERMKEYTSVSSLPPLTNEEISALEEAGAKGPSVKLEEIMCRTCAGYNCTYCERFAGVPIVGQDDAASRASRATVPG
ncbi:Aldo/keto reductase [Exidia glandulosa HHB12029]|uniref:Aldo/keto reductase n=1 Tax=Exidia glandulosa HHB12029 TaxID=1314781 RepID=A0A165IKY5_EXIGL|nr:Aldo/keto reductase [Exidia glandulosa HHB12029]